MAPEGPQGIRAYHGSPHDFDKFDLSKIGTGEGAQAYGHGLYFAENEGVAGQYRNKLSNRPDVHVGGEPFLKGGDQFDIFAKNDADRTVASRLSSWAQHQAIAGDAPGTTEAAISNVRNDLVNGMDMAKRRGDFDLWKRLNDQSVALDRFVERGIELKPNGRLYEVRINANPEDFLDWDKPLSAQSEKVKAAIEPLARAIVEKGHPEDNTRYLVKSGSGVQHALTKWGADRLASKAEPFKTVDDLIYRHGREKLTDALREAGVQGIKYFDQQSRGTGEGTRNYVVFRDDIISILKKYGLAGLLAGGAAATQGQEAKASP